MLNKNKKIIIAGVVVLVVIVVVLLVVALLAKRQVLKQVQDDRGLGEVRTAVSLDEYVKTDAGLMQKENSEALMLPLKEVTPPVPTQIELRKITMAPIGIVGGDAVYAVIGELPDNKFFRLEPDNLNKIFSVNSPEEALKYVDFLMVTAGRTSYDRARTTIWRTADYEKSNCKTLLDKEEVLPPKDRPVSQAKVSGSGFEVSWVYFTPVLPAGYHKMIFQVEKDGSFEILENPDEPFFACGGGVVF